MMADVSASVAGIQFLGFFELQFPQAPQITVKMDLARHGLDPIHAQAPGPILQGVIHRAGDVMNIL